MRNLLLLSSAALIAASSPSPSRRSPESIVPNDNRHPAGALAKGVLTVSLEARTGVWYPEGPTGRGVDVAAFAEAGKGLSAPGPLIRVQVGTEVRASIRNTFDAPLTVFGFGKTRGRRDSVIVAPHASR